LSTITPCFPLDDHYKAMPEAKLVRGLRPKAAG
jgi:hypothetical protein